MNTEKTEELNHIPFIVKKQPKKRSFGTNLTNNLEFDTLSNNHNNIHLINLEKTSKGNLNDLNEDKKKFFKIPPNTVNQLVITNNNKNIRNKNNKKKNQNFKEYKNLSQNQNENENISNNIREISKNKKNRKAKFSDFEIIKENQIPSSINSSSKSDKNPIEKIFIIQNKKEKNFNLNKDPEKINPNLSINNSNLSFHPLTSRNSSNPINKFDFDPKNNNFNFTNENNFKNDEQKNSIGNTFINNPSFTNDQEDKNSKFNLPYEILNKKISNKKNFSQNEISNNPLSVFNNTDMGNSQVLMYNNENKIFFPKFNIRNNFPSLNQINQNAFINQNDVKRNLNINQNEKNENNNISENLSFSNNNFNQNSKIFPKNNFVNNQNFYHNRNFVNGPENFPSNINNINNPQQFFPMTNQMNLYNNRNNLNESTKPLDDNNKSVMLLNNPGISNNFRNNFFFNQEFFEKYQHQQDQYNLLKENNFDQNNFKQNSNVFNNFLKNNQNEIISSERTINNSIPENFISRNSSLIDNKNKIQINLNNNIINKNNVNNKIIEHDKSSKNILNPKSKQKEENLNVTNNNFICENLNHAKNLENKFSLKENFNSYENKNIIIYSNPQIPEEYFEEILQNLKNEENLFKFNLEDRQFQNEITEKMRLILVSWLIEVHKRFKLLDETLYLTVNLIDICLHSKTEKINKNNFQLLGISSMLLACKYEEIYFPELNDFYFITDRAFTIKQIIEMEWKILIIINYIIIPCYQVRFLELYKYLFELSEAEFDFCKYIGEISIMDSRFLKYENSLIVLSGIFVTIKALSDRFNTIEEKFNIELKNRKNEFKDCSKLICFHLDNSTNNEKFVIIKERYLNSKSLKNNQNTQC